MFVNNQEAIIRQIEQHAYSAIPNEICGLVLIGPDGYEYLPCDNKAADKQRAFEIDPALIALHYDRIAYVVHSHVNKPPAPSERDIVACNRLKKPYFIISVPSRELFTVYPQSHRPNLKDQEFFYGASDCFALVRDFYQTEFGIALHDPIRLPYGWWLKRNDSNEHVTLQAALQHGFRIVDTPRHGDVIILKVNAEVPSHWAIYLGDGDILQNALNTKARRETYNGLWRRSTVYFLRHHERD